MILGAAQARSRWSRGLAPWLVATGVGVLLCVIATGRGAAQSVNGRLLDDSTRAPIEQARVVLLTPDGRVLNRALTAKDGTFHLPAPAPGRYWVRAQRIGYAPTTSGPVEVPGFDSVVVELRLSAQALLLPPVSVVGPPLPTAVPDPYLERRGYYERRAAYGEEGMGVAHFLDAKKLRPAALQISDLLRELPGIYVTVPGGGKTVVTARGGASPRSFSMGRCSGISTPRRPGETSNK